MLCRVNHDNILLNGYYLNKCAEIEELAKMGAVTSKVFQKLFFLFGFIAESFNKFCNLFFIGGFGICFQVKFEFHRRVIVALEVVIIQES